MRVAAGATRRFRHEEDGGQKQVGAVTASFNHVGDGASRDCAEQYLCQMLQIG